VNTQTRAAVAELARAVVALRPLAEAGYPLRTVGDHAEVAGWVAGALGITLPAADGGEPSAGRFDAVVAELLRPHLDSGRLAGIGAADRPQVAAIARQVADTGFDGLRATDAVAADGAVLRTYAAGDPGRPAIVVASACGMPARLCEPWLRVLAADHYAVTWETRGLFGGPLDGAGFDALGYGLETQAADLQSVMDQHKLPSAHVMGLCGGAVIAVRAAADRPDRISSLSLWHGDFSGSPGPTTNHQDNLKALMAMAAGSRGDAAAINAALAQTAMSAVPAEVAHLVGYPYASDELFYRYCLLTGATMTTDVSAALGRVRQPTLLVTSEDDHTAHPGGTHRAAALLPGAVLRVEPHGDHISVFGAGPRLQRILTDFLGGPHD
jgi:pimeloyl-ACP methyl ester carboxylesterase